MFVGNFLPSWVRIRIQGPPLNPDQQIRIRIHNTGFFNLFFRCCWWSSPTWTTSLCTRWGACAAAGARSSPPTTFPPAGGSSLPSTHISRTEILHKGNGSRDRIKITKLILLSPNIGISIGFLTLKISCWAVLSTWLRLKQMGEKVKIGDCSFHSPILF